MNHNCGGQKSVEPPWRGKFIPSLNSGSDALNFRVDTVFLKPRANGRNIVGQRQPTLLDGTCCIPYSMSLRKV